MNSFATLESVLPGAVTVWYFTKKLQSGKVWREEISTQIDRADWFVLLILDPLAKLDWCLYEAGQFIGKWEEKEQHGEAQEAGQKYRLRRPLTCLAGIEQSLIPSQLNDLQHVHATKSDPTPVENFLRQLVVGDDTEELDLFRQYWKKNSDSGIKKVAEDLCKLIDDATIRRNYCCEYLDIQVKRILPLESLQALPGPPAAAPAKNADAQSDDAFAVSGEAQSLTELFALDRSSPTWTAFAESVRLHHDPPSWFDELSQYLRGPNTSDYPAYTPFLRNNAQYQPLLYRVDKRDAGERVFRILFHRTKAAHYVPVSDFHELMDKLVEQLKRKKNERTYFMAYTPALGFLALPETEWEKLREAMLDNVKKISLICPLEPDIRSFHQEFMGKKTGRTEKIQPELIDSANRAAEQLIKEVQAGKGRVRRLARGSLPSYYLFFGKSWGIIAVPFFQTSGQQSDIPTAEMFGLLTTNEIAIDLFLSVFEQVGDSA